LRAITSGLPSRVNSRRQFQIALQRGGIDHLDQDIGGMEGNGWLFRFVRSHRRPAVTPEKILDQDAVVCAQRVQRIDSRQVDQRDLLESDVDQTLAIGVPVAQQSPVLRRGARGG
jgi:hypothetical protein